MRLGVARAIVNGQVLAGDIDVDPDEGLVLDVGLSAGSGGGSGTAVAGLVDLQVNGFAGVDFARADAQGYASAVRALAAHGAVAVQPTFFSCSPDSYVGALEVLAGIQAEPPVGCRLLGAHLEGPFLSAEWAGAHDRGTFLDPDPSLIDRFLAAGPLRCMTVAPELPGGLELVRQLTSAGVVVSIGHTNADAEEVRAAVELGARHLTHCWNAHRRFTPRDPGPAGLALADPRVTVGLIADLVHVSAEVVRLTMAAASGRTAVTTDALAVAGSATGAAGAGPARRANGALAGGTATPDELLRRLVGLGIPLAQALDACGGAQRRVLGLPEVLVRPGDPADLVVLDDALLPLRTLVAGREVWANGGA